MAYSPNDSFEASNPIVAPAAKGMAARRADDVGLAARPRLRLRLGVLRIGQRDGGQPALGMLVLDDLEAFLRVGSFRYEQGDLDTAIRIIRRGRAVLVTPSVARRYNLSLGGEFMLTNPARARAVPRRRNWRESLVGVHRLTRRRGDIPGTSIPIGYFVAPRPGVETEPIKARCKKDCARFHSTSCSISARLYGGDGDFHWPFVQHPGSAAQRLTVLALVIASLGQSTR